LFLKIIISEYFSNSDLLKINKAEFGLILMVLFFSIHYFTYSNQLENDTVHSKIYESISQDHILKNKNKYEIRHFDKNKLNELQKDKDFNYNRKPIPEFNIIDLIYKLFSRYFLEPLSKIIGSSNTKILFIFISILLSSILTFLIIRKKINQRINLNINDSHPKNLNNFELVNQLDYKTEIENAIRQNDFHNAVRLEYLQTLKLLFTYKILKFGVSKTNSDYLNEIKNSEFYSKFELLSDIFNYINYGQFDITKEEYCSVKTKFNEFALMVGSFE
jgi:preprotein translocase subunit YajC